MKTVFKVGMKVYDQIYEPDVKGEVLDVNMQISSHPITVKFGSCVRYYTAEGCRGRNQIRTLSTSPYRIEGFEQKAPAPTIKDALEWLRKNDGCDEFDNNYPKKENVFCFEALRKLIILRDYYNEGWQPKNSSYVHIITTRNRELVKDCLMGDFRVLYFKSIEIRNTFFEEQKELLEIAKPLL